MRKYFFLVLLLGWISGTTVAKDYSVPRVVIDAVIHADGTVTYEEHRTYRFDGSFSEADYQLSRVGFDTVRDIQVREGTRTYQLDRSKRAGNYRVKEDRRTVDIVWNYDARDEERTFTISYVLEGAVIRGPDHAEFFWTYLSDRWETGTDELEVNLRFESGVDPNELLHFLRGATGKIDVSSVSDGYRLTGRDFSRRNSVAMRTVFPADLVSDMPVTDPDFARENVLMEEEQLAAEVLEAEARRERRAEIWTYVALFLALFSVFFFGMLYQRYGENRPRLRADIPDELHEPPSEHPPAIAAEIIQPDHLGGRHLVATLFEFCGRRYYRIVQREAKKGLFKSGKPEYEVRPGDVDPDEETLRLWEAVMVDLIHTRTAEGEPTIKNVFDLSEGKQQKWFSNWKKLIRKDVDDLKLYHPDNRKAMTANILLQLPILILSIVAIAFAGPIGFLPAVISFVALVLSELLRHRTDEGEALYRGWRAYRNTLRKGDPSMLAGNLDAHFPYAVAFGLTNQRTGELVSHAPAHAFLWITAMDGSTISPALLSDSVTTMTSSVTATVASGTGAAVGVAGGGAGGGAR